MTIKTKLTLNVLIVLGIVVAVTVTSILGLGFVRNKLSYLTEKSTPFQMRTVEFQRAIQGMTADLIKVSAAHTKEEFGVFRGEAEKSLSEVKSAQTALEELSGGAALGTHQELKKVAEELFVITGDRITAQEEARASDALITQKTGEAGSRLRDLDSKIQSLQTGRQGSFITSLADVGTMSSKLRNIELLKAVLKDLQVAVFELRRVQDKKGLIIARGKLNSLSSKAHQNPYVREVPKIAADVKGVTDKIDEMVKLYMSPPEDTKVLEGMNRDLDERLSVMLLSIEQEAISASEMTGVETEKQNSLMTQSGIATNILLNNAQLITLGITVQGLSARLFTIDQIKDADRAEVEMRKNFEKIETVTKAFDKGLSKLSEKEAQKTLQNVSVSLSAIRNLLLAQDGVIAKIRNRITMEEKGRQATGKIRAIVLKQAEKSKETVSTAKGDQEKAIGTVNKMVRFSTGLILAISAGAIVFGVLFGTWIYRSISRPLANLILASDEVAKGNLAYKMAAGTKDEIGRVQASMAAMVTNLQDIVGRMRTATGGLASSSEELSATADVLEKGSQGQTLQIEQAATAMTEMSQTTMDVAKNASETAEAAQKMKKTALQGQDVMKVTLEELHKFAGTFKESAVKIEGLGKKSDEINNVVTLIREIADQTNLLALNAAIEAARAGEQGRGFAVVADEVRKLAERTAQATDDIGVTVRTMQSEVKESVGFMKKEKDSVEIVLEKVTGTKKSIEEIVTYVEQVADMIQRIAVATDEQSSTSDMVSHSMEDVAVITRQLGSSIVEIKRASGDLSRLAAELNTMAGWFKT